MTTHSKPANSGQDNDSATAARDDRDRRALARKAFPVLERYCYLNTGAVGPVSTIYAETLSRWTADDLANGRAHGQRFARLDAAREDLRREIAALVGAAADDIVLTQRTSSGLALVVELFRWQPGDEIVCTDLEHSSCRIPLEQLARRFGLSLRVANVPTGDGAALDWLTRQLTSKTRLIVFSATTFEAGLVLPAAEIASLARERGIMTLLDAAQGAGAMPLDLPALGIDYCALPLQKWLCGPEGLGALYLRPDSIEALVQRPGDRVVHGIGILAATIEHLSWARKTLGWNWVLTRTAQLAAEARAALSAVPHARLLTPPAAAGLTSVAFDGRDTAQIARSLADRGVVVRHLERFGALRISTAFFNSRDDLLVLTEHLDELTR